MSGCSDSLTPPRLAVVLLSVLFLFLYRDERSLSSRFFSGFIPGYLFAAFLLRMAQLKGGYMIVWLFGAAGCFYTGIGVVLTITGAYFAFQWFRMYRSGGAGDPLLNLSREGRDRWFPVFLPLMGFLLGALVSFFAYSWPVTVALMALSNDIYLPGLLWPTVWCLFFYELVISMVLTAVFFAASYSFDSRRRRAVFRYRSLTLSVAAAVYMSFGVSLVSIYIQQLF